MTRLLENRSRAADLGRAGRQEYLQKGISWEDVVEKLLA